MSNPILTAATFDRLAKAKARANPAGLLWGAKAIGRHIGRSTDFVVDTLAREPDTPVKKIGRQYCVTMDALDAYFGNNLNNPA